MDTKQKILIGFIIMIIIVILLLIFFDKIKNLGVEQTHKEICKRQVEINAISTTMQSRIDCPIINVTIKSDPNSKATKERIALLMKDVRDVYGVAWEGADLFGAESGVFCSVYAIVDFTQKDKYLEDFEKYLAETPYTFMKSDSFMDYFSNSKEGFSKNLLPKISGSKLSTNDRYAVLFWYIKNYDKIDSAFNWLGNAVQGKETPGAYAGGRIYAVGGGALISAAGVMLIATGVGVPFGVTLFGIGAAGALVGGGSVASIAIYKELYGEGPKTAAQVLLVRYNSQDDLKNIGCEIFPVSLGTRPQ